MREKGEEVWRINAADSPQDLEFVQEEEHEDAGIHGSEVEKIR